MTGPDLPRTERPDAPAYLTRYQSRGTGGPTGAPDGAAADADVPALSRAGSALVTGQIACFSGEWIGP